MTYTLTIQLGAWLDRYVVKNATMLPPELSSDPQKKHAYVWTGSEPQTPEMILKALGIPLTEVGIVTQNKTLIELTTSLSEDCQLAFFPVIVGG